METQDNKRQRSFKNLSIKDSLLGQLEKLNYQVPTPIQHQLIPIAIKGEDVIGIAQTGTGKTLAFAIPIIQKIADNKGQALVIAPTRELALQIEETFKKIGFAFGLKTVVLIGGTPMGPQIRQIKNRYHVIIATPGRLLDHLTQKTLLLDKVQTLILDEADRMLDMGFEPDIKKIFAQLKDQDLQTMLFSATMPVSIARIANKYLKKPLRIEISPAGSTARDIAQEIFIVTQGKKEDLLKNLLEKNKDSVLIFCRTKFGVKKIAKTLRLWGHTADEIHSNRSLAQRRQALAGFKSGRYKILVATDIASRGIDVTAISLVINYDLPEQPEDYVHRIGRTGRAGLSGKAISFVPPEQKYNIKVIEKLIKTNLPIKTVQGITQQPDTSNFVSQKKSRQKRRRSFGKKYRR